MLILGALQRELAELHGTELGADVRDFVVDDEALVALGLPTPKADEELLVHEHEGDLELALWYARPLRQRFPALAEDVAALLREGLPTFCVTLEGVSHFHYLSRRATVPRPVSRLELELQAEVDKFALLALRLVRAGRAARLPELSRRLFDEVSFHPHLEPEALERYRTANRLARAFARTLTRHLVCGDVDGALRRLRRLYRLGAGEKLAFCRAGAW